MASYADRGLESCARVLSKPCEETSIRKVHTHTAAGLSWRSSLNQMDFLSPRKIFTFNRWDGTVLSLYTAILAWTIAHHEQWFDESQAWLIARDSSLGEMLTRWLRYEGAPPLWHLILWVLTRLHVPFMAMNWVTALFAICGIAVFLRYAPFPRLSRVLIPFTFFFQYQYAVIARSYVLFPLFVFVLCVLHLDERPRVLWFALVCGLFSNLNVHGLLFSGAILPLYIWKLYRQARSEATTSRSTWIAGAVIYCSFILTAVYVLLPPPDVNFAIQGKIKQYNSGGLLARITPPQRLPAGAPRLDPILPVGPQPVPPMNRLQRAVWTRSHGTVGSSLEQKVVNRLYAYAALLDFPISSSNVVALMFVFSLVLWLWARRAVVFLLPYFVLLTFEALVWTWVHQTGLLLIALLAALWLGNSRPQVRGGGWIAPFFAAMSMCVIATQIGWTIFSVRYDTKYLYDPGHVTHDFLVSNYPGKRIAAFTFQIPNVQPFSDHNMFVNHATTFWIWSSEVYINERRTEALAMQPDIILTGDEDFGDDVIPNQWVTLLPRHEHLDTAMLQYWESHGFHETHRFCGARPIRFGFANTTCDVILERNS